MTDSFLWMLKNFVRRPKSRKQRSARRGWVYSELLFRNLFEKFLLDYEGCGAIRPWL